MIFYPILLFLISPLQPCHLLLLLPILNSFLYLPTMIPIILNEPIFIQWILFLENQWLSRFPDKNISTQRQYCHVTCIDHTVAPFYCYRIDHRRAQGHSSSSAHRSFTRCHPLRKWSWPIWVFILLAWKSQTTSHQTKSSLWYGTIWQCIRSSCSGSTRSMAHASRHFPTSASGYSYPSRKYQNLYRLQSIPFPSFAAVNSLMATSSTNAPTPCCCWFCNKKNIPYIYIYAPLFPSTIFASVHSFIYSFISFLYIKKYMPYLVLSSCYFVNVAKGITVLCNELETSSMSIMKKRHDELLCTQIGLKSWILYPSARS